ncbi:DUF1360 domain-containing protein [Siminovitchia sp. FSL H7-0308]|jgi:antibiotic biosynthesis monooxygenase (ABM) superfamily enzyme|uniref:Antibiotic biosynthesis monooxygenase (ABM) superfamily enzyme n=1 Tax=Siminovitchia thermophila TaxID=1245522 RepID=A0ABS2RCN7_9BACI|nr:DUF1360 domain-containing protein [Siminovitchia thermophila]MBM7717344.1 antibiotic biosynthesis monooxygenase (ABM) superfamily enzyme [Siminovitchia thermophila]ONK24387.1 sporulation protein [Bacillus sp. VT-16-64]
MDISWMELGLLSLAIFRLTRLFVYDEIMEWLRKPFMKEYEEENEAGEKEVYYMPIERGFRGWVGSLLSCYWCTGVWIAAGLYVCYVSAPIIAEPIIVIFSLAGLAALIETIVQAIISD